ncbi:MAG: hypothetical protein P4L45_13385 [Ignavibacteriaceae bacterium]|nr:hypothetical protein [Ignavibacteriaceae bacterium]
MQDSNSLDITVDQVKLNAWFNLMPGSKPSFHLLGKLNIKNNNNNTIENLKLQQGIIYNGTTEVVKFTPVVTNQANGSGFNVLPKETKEFTFALPDKIRIENMADIKEINLLLKFSSNGKTYDYAINNVNIEKVY